MGRWGGRDCDRAGARDMAMDPLTPKGEEIKSAMEKEYGSNKGEGVFYASANKGTITGVHDGGPESGPQPGSGRASKEASGKKQTLAKTPYGYAPHNQGLRSYQDRIYAARTARLRSK